MIRTLPWILKTFYLFVATGLTLVASITPATATHLAGGTIRIICAGGNQVRIQLIKYRDPGGAGMTGGSLTITGGTTQTVTTSLLSSNTNLPQPNTSPCLIPPPNSSLEEYIYQTNPLTIAPGSSYTVYHTQANRNSTNTIPTQQSMVLYAEIQDPGIYGCNNSPIFNENPPMAVCLNEPLQYDGGATDPDGDVLQYRFCNALTGTNPPFAVAAYAAPYSGTYPVSSAPALAIDINTGLVTGTPNLIGGYSGRWTFNYCVDEYRGGVKIAEYNREVQMTVTTCNIPVTANVGTHYTSIALGVDVIASCDDYTVTFNNTSNGGSSFFWDFGVPGITKDTSSQHSPTYTYPDTGTFTVTLIINKGYSCADTITKTVIVYPVTNADFSYSLPACQAQPISFTDQSTMTYGFPIYWSWQFGNGGSSGQQNPNYVYNTAGNYNTRLTFESSKGCRDTVFKLVQVGSKPVLGGGGNKSICEGGSVVLNASVSPPPPNTTISWAPSTGLSCTNCLQPVASPDSNIIYTVTATGPTGCTNQATVLVAVTTPPTVDAGPDKYVCGTQSTQLDGSATSPTGYSVSWSPATGLSAPNILTPQAAPGATTTYVLTLTSSIGCVVKDTVTVFVSNLIFDAGSDTTICAGDTAQLNGSISAPDLIYSWAPANLLSDPNRLDPKAFPSSSQVFTLTVTDTLANCTDEDTIRVDVSHGPPVSAGSDTTICENGSAVLQASGGASYTWDNDPTLSCLSCAGPVASPAATKEYFVTSTDAFGCPARDSVTVSVVPLPTVTISADTLICPGDPVTLVAGGGTSYQWMPSANLSCDTCPTVTSQPSSATSYTVEVTDANGCQNTGQVNVSFRNKPNVTISQNQEICLHDTVQLMAGGGVSYQWSPAAGLSSPNVPDPLASPSVTTEYTVEVTDAFGCWSRDSVEVKVNVLQPGNFIGDTSVCIGNSIGLFANGFTSYQWSPASSLSCTNCPNPVASPASTTIYTIEVQDALGCADTGYVEVVVNPLPSITLTPDQVTCEGEVVQLQAGGGASYSWTPSQGLSCSSCPSPSAIPNSSRRYTVEVTDGNGCKDTSSVGVTVLPAPPVSAGTDITICDGDTAQLTGSGAATYQWSPGTDLSCTNCASPDAYPSTTTEYQLTGTHANGCQRFDTVVVEVNPVPTASVTPASKLICDGDSVQLQASGGISYQWSPAANLSCSTCPDPYAFPLVNTAYTVRAINQYGCWDEAVAQVDVTSAASANVTPDTGVCPNGSIQLSASGGAGSTYTWAPNIEISDPNTSTPTVSPTQPREYTVTIVDQNGCEVVIPVFIDIYVPADPLAGVDAVICLGDSTPLTAGNGISYSWAPAAEVIDPAANSTLAAPTTSTVYTVTIVDVHGCTNTDMVSITVHPLPNVDAGPDQVVYENKAAYLSAAGASSYSWTPHTYFVDTTGPSIILLPQDTITYYVLGTDANGCRNVDSVTIFVVPNTNVFIPTGFSPNGDGKNDVFRVAHYTNFNLKSMRVYDRWGALIFESSDPMEGWTGRGSSGELMPVGTYIYVVEGIDDLGKPILKKGNITLLR